MARFRRGHQQTRGSGLRMGTLAIGILIALAALLMARKLLTGNTEGYIQLEPLDPVASLPSASGGQIVHHRHYSLSYAEQFEQAQWVAYELTLEELNAPRVQRTDWFYADYAITTRSAFHRDYSGSGYTRGHLAPAADMAFDSVAMRESFFMSNISPQRSGFNAGIWRELEEQVRDWARDIGVLYIVTGPVLHAGLDERIGTNRVAVPELFYKVLYDPLTEGGRGIAFVMPNAISEAPLLSYAVTIDSVEALTGIDFFASLEIESVEGNVDLGRWPVDKFRYQKRIREWNFR